jgi:4-amino-4-deoxy-L-arabinose transferase-like glycosyltransferase
MDQAQVGRPIAAGAGYSTLYVRPLAMWQFLGHEERLPSGFFPDTYNFPLNPLVNAVVLRPIKRWWPMGPTDLVYVGDRAIATAGVAFFLASIFVLFFLVRSLFDRKIAWLTAGLVLVSDMMWRFSISGLPQMLMLFLFTLALLLLHWAFLAREDQRTGRMLLLLSGCAILLGLMTLAQPMAAWIFLGFLGFVFLWFKPRAVSGLLVFFLYLGVVAPWLVRNYLVCGNPLGLGIFAILDGTTGSELSFMSTLQPELTAFGAVRAKLRGGLTSQFENLFGYLGYGVAAAAFFFSLLHVFKRRETNLYRWALVLMWIFAALGMAFFAPRGTVSANQLHMLFLPLFSAYGIAFLLVLWNRLDLRLPFARKVFLGVVFALTALPMAINLLTAPAQRVHWPPYIPPFINSVANWMDPGEVLCSDMPWATAWYGGRLTLLLPATIKQFIDIHDYKYLGGPVNGIYFTPVSGNRPWLTQIAKGEYREWATFIMRTAELERFPLQFFTPLPIDNECVFYSNRDRWTPRE